MGKKTPYVPSLSQLIKTRVARCVGDLNIDTFDTVVITFYTVEFLYAGHHIKYIVAKDADGTERLKRKPKKPNGLHVEDIQFLDSQARMAIKAVREGIHRSKERRAEEAEYKRKCAEAELSLELLHDKPIGTGSDAREQLRQTSLVPEEDKRIDVPEEKDSDDPPF